MEENKKRDENEEQLMAKERQEFLQLLAKICPKRPIPTAEDDVRSIAPRESNLLSDPPIAITPPTPPSPARKSYPISPTASPSDKQAIADQNYIKICIHDKESKRRVTYHCPKAALILKTDAFKERSFACGFVNLQTNNIFYSWFCRWLIKDPPLVIESETVFPLLKIAEELNINELVVKCLKFWRNHVNEMGYEENVWMSFNKQTLLDFANMFENRELDAVSNQPDLQNHLYEQFIYFLNEATPKKHLGHYASTSRIFQCKHCGKLLTPDVERLINCQMIELDCKGAVRPNHKRAADWSLSGMLVRLRRNLWSWKMVYWRLWGSCHYVSCSVCLELFPLTQMNWCRHHSITAPDHQVSDSNSAIRLFHPCCKQYIQPFKIVPTTSGCQYRPHIPLIKTPTIAEIMEIYSQHQVLINMEPSNELKSDQLQMAQPALENVSLIKKKLFTRSKKHSRVKYKTWSQELSVGWNQDNQRELEEKRNRDIQKFLTKKCCREADGLSPRPIGGSYVMVENDWFNSLMSSQSEITADNSESIPYAGKK